MHHSADNTPEVMNAIESALDKIRAALAYTGLTYRGAPNIPDWQIIRPDGVPRVVFDLQIEVPLELPTGDNDDDDENGVTH